MAIQVTQAKPNATVGGVVQAQPGTIGTIGKLPSPPALSVGQPVQTGGNYNPQNTAAAGMVQPAANTKTLMPNTQSAGQTAQPAGGSVQGSGPGAFQFMNGTGFDASGNYQSSPQSSPQQFTPQDIHTAMSVALAAMPAGAQPGANAADSSGQAPIPNLPKGVSPYPPGYDPTNLNADISQVQQNTQLSPAELDAQKKLNDLTASENFGLTKIEQDPNLVMPLLTGQQQALQHQAENMAVPLQQQLAMAQAKRQAALQSSQFALDREDKNLEYLRGIEKPQTLQPGQTIGTFNQGTQSFGSSYTAPYSPIANPLSPTGITTFGTNGSTSMSTPSSLLGTNAGTFTMGSGPGTAASVNNVSGMKDPTTGKYVQYSSPQASLQATTQDIQNKINGNTRTGLNGNSTLDQFVKTWITGNANSTAKTGYSSSDVASLLGVTPGTPISQIGADKLAQAVAHFETGYTPGQSGQSQPTAGQSYTGNPIVDSTITQLLNGVPPSQIQASPQVLQLASTYATQIDPKFNPATSELNYQNQQKAQANAVPLIQAQKTAIDHLQNLQTLVDAAKYGNNQLWNNARDFWNANVSRSQPITDLKSAIGVVRGEVAKVLGGGTATVESLQEAQSVIPDNLSSSMMQSVIKNVQDLMQSKIKEYSSLVNINGQQVLNQQGQGAGGSLTIDQIKQAYHVNY